MIQLLKRLLGMTHAERAIARGRVKEHGATPVTDADAGHAPAAQVRPSTTDGQGRSSPGGDVVKRYFELSAEIEQGKADHDFLRAIAAARASYPLLPAFVRRWEREYGSFDIRTSHAVHTAPVLMAVMEDGDGLRELRNTLQAVAEVRQWLSEADEAEAALRAVPLILRAVRDNPGILQSSLKKPLPAEHHSRASRLVAWLEKGGRICRVRDGSTFQLYPSGYMVQEAPSSHPASPERGPTLSPIPKPHTSRMDKPPRARARRSAEKARPLDLATLPVIRLPMPTPSGEWAGGATRSGTAEGKRGGPRFVVDGEGWSVASEEKVASANRVDPAYKDVFHTRLFTHWVDPAGRRVGFEEAASVLRVSDRHGKPIAERGLAHDTYRADVNADGTAILFLSRDAVLHGYTETLDLFIEESVTELPEYQAQDARLGIGPRAIKNHIRCVAISSDRRQHLVTVVDEAWCLDTATGAVAWGLRMPSKEGWARRVPERSPRTGTSAEVEAALNLMGLELPVSPEDLPRRYRTLALQVHPDRNPGDPGATRRFQDLASAMELLSGTDLSSLPAAALERGTYEQVLFRQCAGAVTVTASIVVGESHASDWIYAANFGEDGRVFLAGYSGKLVVVSPQGVPERVYDIGGVPRHVAEAGDNLYVVTDDRLYVLSADRLVALIDVQNARNVVVADHGVALFGAKELTWFTAAGRRVGAVRTKDPLRQAFSRSEGLIVKTRQHRALIKGIPQWWS